MEPICGFAVLGEAGRGEPLAYAEGVLIDDLSALFRLALAQASAHSHTMT